MMITTVPIAVPPERNYSTSVQPALKLGCHGDSPVRERGWLFVFAFARVGLGRVSLRWSGLGRVSFRRVCLGRSCLRRVGLGRVGLGLGRIYRRLDRLAGIFIFV